MNKILAFGFCILSLSVSVATNAQTVNPNPGSIPLPQTVYNSGGIIQGGIGFSGSTQCGTSISTGLSNTVGYSPTIVTDRLMQGGSNSLALQISITHQLGNPCLSQKEQLEIQAKANCLQSKTQFILNNPSMPIPEKQSNLSLFDDICGKNK
jgi:hypothetical protein